MSIEDLKKAKAGGDRRKVEKAEEKVEKAEKELWAAEKKVEVKKAKGKSKHLIDRN